MYTASNGCPVANPEEYQRIGTNGPLLLQDFHLIDLLAHFDRERIPERVVHAKGASAYGEFEVTDDISDIVSGVYLFPEPCLIITTILNNQHWLLLSYRV